MYIKYALLQLHYIPIIIIGLIIHPFIYLFKHSIEKYPKFWKWLLLYWFADNYENNFIDRWYGVYEIYNKDYDKFTTLNWWQKYKLSYEWLALRNPHWNYQMLYVPKLGVKYDVKKIINEGEHDIWTWRNKNIFGKQFVTWKTEGKKYFRYSFTKEVGKFNILRALIFVGYLFTFKIKWFKNWNFMAGVADNRYLIKLRFFD